MSKSDRRRGRTLAPILAIALAFAAPRFVVAGEEGYGLDEGIALLGIVVGTEERDAVDVFVEEGKFLLPATETFDAINTVLREADGTTFLDTPIGSIEIEPGVLRKMDGGTFIGEDFLIEILSTPVDFDIEAYAVVLNPPWDADAPIKSGSGDDEPLEDREPDVSPPIIGMTSAHGDVFTTFSSSADDVGVSSTLELNGHALGGVWRLRYSGSRDTHELADYAWMRQVSNNVWTLLGRQQVGVHSLIDVVDMTGAQVAWSNRAKTFEDIDDIGGLLIGRTAGAGRRFEGVGPAGGRVELVVDGLIVSETIIGVDGTYSIESPLLAQRRSEIELQVFEPQSKNQIDTINLTVTANRFLAPEGSISVIAGAGLEGNFLDQDDERGEATGFVRARYAPLADLTLEAAAVFDPDDGLEGAVGAAFQMGRFGTAYVGAGVQDNGSTSFEGQYYGKFDDTTVTARSLYRETDGADRSDRDDQGTRAEVHDHLLEVSHEYSSRLRFGAIARHTLETSYVLPFIGWRPRRNLSFEAKPNRDGDYRFEARATPFEDVNIEVFYEGAGFARVSYDFETEATGSTSVSLSGEYDEDDGGFGVALGLQGSRIFGLDTRWRVRAERNEDSTTGTVGLRHRLRPGLSVYADGGVRRFDDGRDEDVFGSLGVSFDLGFSDGTIAAAPRSSTNPRFGRLSGRVIPPAGVELSEEDLTGARLVVDGQPVGRVTTDGSYWLSRVPKGVRAVRLEADELPIDLVVDSGTTYAEIAPGAATAVNFELAIEVGAAGRVVGPEGKPVPDVPLEMIDADGEVIATADSNTFGLFRMDGLRPGTYTLRALDIWEGSSREVEIGTEYLFGTDLNVDKPAKSAEREPKPVTEP